MIRQAEAAISEKIGRIESSGSFYRTAAWGNPDQADFINRVMMVVTDLSAREVMENILEIETGMGRVRSVKNAPRTIDIDILFYNTEIIREDGLSIPHPHIQDRRFVLVPLSEIAPELIHPVSGKTAVEMLTECTDMLSVDKI